MEVRRPFAYARAVIDNYEESSTWIADPEILLGASLVATCDTIACAVSETATQPGKGIFTLTHHAGLHQQSRVIWHHQICSLLFCCGIQWGEVAMHLDNGWRLAWIQPITR